MLKRHQTKQIERCSPYLTRALKLTNALDYTDAISGGDDILFARIAADIRHKGYSINPSALPVDLGGSLDLHINSINEQQFDQAGIGSTKNHMHNSFVRRDKISWITGETDAERAWLRWTQAMLVYLNRQLILGLFSFESHFAHYATGDFYKRHLDAFKDEGNRILSVVVYLNHDWVAENAGELVLYSNIENDETSIKVTPSFGTVLVFLSEEFPHEVLPTHRDRYSIAGWFRLNSSTTQRVDPPA